MPVTLQDLGWDSAWQIQFDLLSQPGLTPARLIYESKSGFIAMLEGGDTVQTVVSGKIWHTAQTDAQLPAVGDWVAVDLNPDGETVIRELLPRRTCFSRKTPGKSSAEQVLGANVDLVAVVTAPGADFNPRRIERYLTLIRRSGAHAVLILNKIDLYPQTQTQEATQSLLQLAPDCTVLAISALHDKNLTCIRNLLSTGKTMCMIGSSGVGKSTLINTLAGSAWLDTGTVNAVTGKGRHTTIARELILLPDGGLLMDNPGIREVQMWTDEHTLRESFADLTALTHKCRFADCSHRADAGCAIRNALHSGALDTARYEGFLNLEQEIALLAKRQKKRRMNMERADKRDRKIKARNYEDRVEWERRHKPNHRNHD